MSQAVLLVRIGWMEKYRGPQPGDERPIGGGEYTKTDLGHEAFNFLPIDGRVYGFIQPTGTTRRVNLERIAGGRCKDSIDDALVVFVASLPDGGGQRVVGWYRDAMLFRRSQKSNHSARKRFEYYTMTRENKATLLPPNRRVCPIPKGKGGFGQSNVCYIYSQDTTPKDMPWVKEVLEFVENYRGPNLVRTAAR